MNPEQTLKMASKVSLYNAKRYLNASGWNFITKFKDVLIFRRSEPEHPFDEILLPRSEEDPYYAQTILDAAERLSRFEKRSVLEIIQDLASPNLDKISFRIISKHAELGSVELDTIDAVFQGICSICMNAIKDLQQPEVFHRRVDNKTIKDMMKYARFGQTEHGSFIVNVLIPYDIPSDEEAALELVTTTAFRDGIVNMLKSISKVQEFILEGNEDDFTKENKEKPFISSNMFLAFDQINQWEDMELEILARWSQLVPIPPETISQVRLRNTVLKKFETFGNFFRSSSDKHQARMQFSGSVQELLGGSEDENGKQTGDVVIKVLSNEGDDFQARISLLDRKWYDTAMKSHREKDLVMFSGELVQIKKKKTIINIKDFQLVPKEQKEEQLEIPLICDSTEV